MPTTDAELISPEISQLVLLFSAQPDLRFPDVDASVLHDAVARVKDGQLEVAHVNAALAAAREALEAQQEALLKLAQRAHGYLRVYAENDERLGEQVEAISLPRPRRAPTAAMVVDPLNPPKRRGRPRKDTTAQSLFEPAAPAGA